MANGESQQAQSNASALAAVLTQLYPRITRLFEGFRFLVEQPVIREQYVMGPSNPAGFVIAPGATNVPLPASDYSFSLEWPFQVTRVRLLNDAQHTYRDWSLQVTDRTFNHVWSNNPILADGLVEANTGFWVLPEPWIIRPAGGGWQIAVSNLDTVNPITIAVELHGNLLIPKNVGHLGA